MLNKTLTVDVETTGLDRFIDTVVCVGWKYNDKETTVSFGKDEKLAKKLKDVTITKIFHNAKFDIHFLNKSGMEVRGPIFDTKLYYHSLDPYNSNRLKDLAKTVLKEIMVIEYKDVVNKRK